VTEVRKLNFEVAEDVVKAGISARYILVNRALASRAVGLG
jgi:hypothetical protein